MRDIFVPQDASLILGILLRDGMQDFIAWHFDEKGVHSVKQAYKLHVKMHEITNELEAGMSGDVHGSLDACESTYWSRIWKMPCQSKINMFTWRLAHNSLALRTNLAARGVEIEDTRCLLCHTNAEDGGHLFVRCKEVKRVWRAMGMEAVRSDL